MVAILSRTGEKIADYEYDAWGRLISQEPAANSIGNMNPLRYRGYIYDVETGFYYLQSRYYDPEIGRFINADAFASTGQGLLGNNMFAYCLNNPVNMSDAKGSIPFYDHPYTKDFEDFITWYQETDENGTDDTGHLTLSAKVKRTINSFGRNLELEAGLGVGIGRVQEVLDHGVAYTCHYDIIAVQLADSNCNIGQRLVMSVYAAAIPYVEVGAGLDAFRKDGRPYSSSQWFLINTTNKSITLFDFADYSYFIGGNVALNLNIVNFFAEFASIWGIEL